MSYSVGPQPQQLPTITESCLIINRSTVGTLQLGNYPGQITSFGTVLNPGESCTYDLSVPRWISSQGGLNNLVYYDILPGGVAFSSPLSLYPQVGSIAKGTLNATNAGVTVGPFDATQVGALGMLLTCGAAGAGAGNGIVVCLLSWLDVDGSTLFAEPWVMYSDNTGIAVTLVDIFAPQAPQFSLTFTSLPATVPMTYALWGTSLAASFERPSPFDMAQLQTPSTTVNGSNVFMVVGAAGQTLPGMSTVGPFQIPGVVDLTVGHFATGSTGSYIANLNECTVNGFTSNIASALDTSTDSAHFAAQTNASIGRSSCQLEMANRTGQTCQGTGSVYSRRY